MDVDEQRSEVARLGYRAEALIYRAAAREIRHATRRGLGAEMSEVAGDSEATEVSDARGASGASGASEAVEAVEAAVSDEACEASVIIPQRELARLRALRRTLNNARRALRIAGQHPTAEARASALADILRNLRV